VWLLPLLHLHLHLVDFNEPCVRALARFLVQEKLSTLLFRASPALQVIASHLPPGGSGGYTASDPLSATGLAHGTRKIKIGFISKFFTANHAHGQLLRVR
jgi:hypothetical protein